MQGLTSIIEIKRSQEALSKGESPFHKVLPLLLLRGNPHQLTRLATQLGYGATLFWEGVLSFNKEVMQRATDVLAEAETTATEHHRMVERDPATGHASQIYPPGAEYLLCQAQAQLLAAILGILKESWTESLTGLNKLRKGYFTIQALTEAEKKYVALHPPSSSQSSTRAPSVRDEKAAESDAASLRSARSGGTKPKAAGLVIAAGDSHLDFRTVTTDPVDLYIHSGVAMVWGIMQIGLSIVPPALKHILSLFSFRGERLEGLKWLWDATDYRDNIFGAIAALVTLVYNHIGVALQTDIVSAGAFPEARLKALLRDLRATYPDSQLWLTAAAREAAIDRDLPRALEVLAIETPSSFPAIQGMKQFELALDLLCLHRFEAGAAAYRRCPELNNWSHALYFYNAAGCHIELYRDAVIAGDSAAADLHAAKAAELLAPVPALARKKFLMGQQLPFDAFIAAKVDKWQLRAKQRNVALAAAVGVSPLEEMAYFWTGYRRLSAAELQVSLDRLAAWEQRPEAAWETTETVDERAASELLQICALRQQGAAGEAAKAVAARERLEKFLREYSQSQIKAACTYPTDWVMPMAHYELAVLIWITAGKEAASKEELRRCREEIEKCEKLGRFSLEDRLVVKLMAAKATLANLGA